MRPRAVLPVCNQWAMQGAWHVPGLALCEAEVVCGWGSDAPVFTVGEVALFGLEGALLVACLSFPLLCCSDSGWCSSASRGFHSFCAMRGCLGACRSYIRVSFYSIQSCRSARASLPPTELSPCSSPVISRGPWTLSVVRPPPLPAEQQRPSPRWACGGCLGLNAGVIVGIVTAAFVVVIVLVGLVDVGLVDVGIGFIVGFWCLGVVFLGVVILGLLLVLRVLVRLLSGVTVAKFLGHGGLRVAFSAALFPRGGRREYAVAATVCRSARHRGAGFGGGSVGGGREGWPLLRLSLLVMSLCVLP